ncbi:hypothetical protein HU200_061505 [Digitaria exilis]|uniref:Uncharacterized protein n=1 Tax=Digitaria exilis TaxID=1010633 RepID=A0A835E0E3_9POAL|nr:hypothetical protein HU200_061505 [Digitaria exilis]
MATPYVYATKASKSAKGGGASVEGSKGSADGPTKSSDAANEGTAEGPGAAMKWPRGGPQFVDMVIKNPFFGTPPPSSSDGLPIDPTPEGSMN